MCSYVDYSACSYEIGPETTSVIVTCESGELRCSFTLIPKEWAREVGPTGERLGINGRNSQGARYFFLNGSLPKPVRGKLIKYFGIEKI